MKQNDIRIGDVLFWNDNNEWARDRGRAYRVVVVDSTVAHWYLDKAGNQHDHGSKVRNPYGTWTVHGVVVEVQDGEGKVRKEIAPIRQLRGTWESCSAVLEACRADRTRVQQEATALADQLHAERLARQANAQSVINRLLDRGAVAYADVSFGGSMIEIDADLLDALVDAIPPNWRYEK